MDLGHGDQILTRKPLIIGLCLAQLIVLPFRQRLLLAQILCHSELSEGHLAVIDDPPLLAKN
jgi:hypothetical protein